MRMKQTLWDVYLSWKDPVITVWAGAKGESLVVSRGSYHPGEGRGQYWKSPGGVGDFPNEHTSSPQQRNQPEFILLEDTTRSIMTTFLLLYFSFLLHTPTGEEQLTRLGVVGIGPWPTSPWQVTGTYEDPIWNVGEADVKKRKELSLAIREDWTGMIPWNETAMKVKSNRSSHRVCSRYCLGLGIGGLTAGRSSRMEEKHNKATSWLYSTESRLINKHVFVRVKLSLYSYCLGPLWNYRRDASL